MKKRGFWGILAVLFLAPLLAMPFAGWAKGKGGKPIVIGCPLSTAFLYGWTAEKGIKLAVEEINASGGVKVGGVRRPFEVVVMDTRDLEPGVPVSEALLVVEKLILEKKADFIIGGPVRSEAALAAMDLLARYKKISIVTTGVLTPKYHKRVAENYKKYKYCFRISNEAANMVKNEMVPFIEQLGQKTGIKRLFIMAQDVAHARAGTGIIKKIMEKKGWEIAGYEIYPTGTTDYSQGLLKAKKAGKGVLLVWMDMPESTILLKQWRELKVPMIPFGFICAVEQPGSWKATKGGVEYAMTDVCNAGNAPSKATPWTMKFYNAYTKRWGVEPEGHGTSPSYMAVYVLKDAIERAGTLKTDAVIKALESTDMMGVYGRIRFDPKSHQVIPALDPQQGAVTSIFQWQSPGKRVVVYPPSIAVGEVKLPEWMM
mgnify:CR=1 FL=1